MIVTQPWFELTDQVIVGKILFLVINLSLVNNFVCLINWLLLIGDFGLLSWLFRSQILYYASISILHLHFKYLYAHIFDSKIIASSLNWLLYLINFSHQQWQQWLLTYVKCGTNLPLIQKPPNNYLLAYSLMLLQRLKKKYTSICGLNHNMSACAGHRESKPTHWSSVGQLRKFTLTMSADVWQQKTIAITNPGC